MSGTAGDVVVAGIEPHLSTHLAPSLMGSVLHPNTVPNHSGTQTKPLMHDAEPSWMPSGLQLAPLPPSLTHVIELDLQ